MDDLGAVSANLARGGGGAALGDLERADVGARQALFDPDGTMAAALAATWAEIADDADGMCSRFWAVLRREPVLRNAYPDDGMAETIRRAVAHTERKFTSPIDEQWVDSVSIQGDLCVRHDLPGRLLIAAIHAAYDHALDRLFDRVTDPALLKRCVLAIHRLAALEQELVLTRLTARQKQAEVRRLAEHSDIFRGNILAAVERLHQASSSLRQQTSAAAATTRDMLARSTEVSASANQSASAMQEATSTTERIVSTIESARADMQHVVGVADKATVETDRTIEIVNSLANSSSEIESIVNTIRDIAGQTNLLALNATIEAARAGEAGRGFAVVAQEVKSLANQTAQATQEVARQIAAIQEATAKAVAASKIVGTTIGDVRETARHGFGKMNDQVEAVNQIAQAVDETSLGVEQVSKNIADVRTSAEGVTSEIDATDRGLQVVDTQLVALKDEVAKFLDLIAA